MSPYLTPEIKRLVWISGTTGGSGAIAPAVLICTSFPGEVRVIGDICLVWIDEFQEYAPFIVPIIARRVDVLLIEH